MLWRSISCEASGIQSLSCLRVSLLLEEEEEDEWEEEEEEEEQQQQELQQQQVERERQKQELQEAGGGRRFLQVEGVAGVLRIRRVSHEKQ